MKKVDLEREIEANLEYFQQELPKIEPENHGKYALIRHQKILGYYDTVTDAVTAGNSSYSDKIFSVQQVTEVPTDLGFYSHAVLLPHAQ